MAVWRTFFYLPSIIPTVASSILWFWILNPNSGLLNGWLAALGIHGPNWLQDEGTSKLSLILMGLWTAGGSMVIWLAGLKGISETYYEAATLDGAGSWQKFVHITLPLLSPYIYFNLIVSLIGTFPNFHAGVRHDSGRTGQLDAVLRLPPVQPRLPAYLNMGYAAALAWFLFLLLMGLTLVQMRLSKRWVHYEGE